MTLTPEDAVAEVRARVADVVSHTNSASVNDEKAIAWVLAAVKDAMLAAVREIGKRLLLGTEDAYKETVVAEAEIERGFGKGEEGG